MNDARIMEVLKGETMITYSAVHYILFTVDITHKSKIDYTII